VLIEAFRERISRELPFPSTGDFTQDCGSSSEILPKSFIGAAGEVFRSFIAGAQADPEIATAFRELWIRPRRAEARKLFEGYIAQGVARASLDPDLAVELLFAPLYYRLLTGWERFRRIIWIGWLIRFCRHFCHRGYRHSIGTIR